MSVHLDGGKLEFECEDPLIKNYREQAGHFWEKARRQHPNDLHAVIDTYFNTGGIAVNASDFANEDEAKRLGAWIAGSVGRDKLAALKGLDLCSFFSDPDVLHFVGKEPKDLTINSAARFASVIQSFARTMVRYGGDKAYEVCPGLRWQLENTMLKGYSMENVKLPFPVIYLPLPMNKYKLEDFWDESDYICGVYVVSMDSPSGDFLSAVSGDGFSATAKDEIDSGWFFILVSSQGNVAINRAFFYVAGSVVDDFSSRDIRGAHGERVPWERLFPYVVNVILYATLPDADRVFMAASKTYRALHARARKMLMGKKKTKVLARLKGMEPRTRIVLGGNIVIDRTTREVIEGKGSGDRKQKVRSLVSGHWHLYWTGKGRTVSTRKWLQPYWRGPELAPLTSKRRVLKD